MSHSTTPTSSQSKKTKIDWDMVIEKSRDWVPPKLHQLLIKRFDIPSDAATARTPESEEGKMVPLFIPPRYEVDRLIMQARSYEGLAEEMERMGSDPVFTGAAAKHAAMAAMYRSKAISLHLGIESAGGE